jgi:hypothetical protein
MFCFTFSNLKMCHLGWVKKKGLTLKVTPEIKYKYLHIYPSNYLPSYLPSTTYVPRYWLKYILAKIQLICYEAKFYRAMCHDLKNLKEMMMIHYVFLKNILFKIIMLTHGIL